MLTSNRLLRDEITMVGRLVMRGMRIVVPASSHKRVLELAYERHQGIVKTKDRLRSKVWWPNMNRLCSRPDGSTTSRGEPSCDCRLL